MRLLYILSVLSISASALASPPNCNVTLRGSGLPASMVTEVTDVLRGKGFTVTNAPGALQFKYEVHAPARRNSDGTGFFPSWTFVGMLDSVMCESTLPVIGVSMEMPLRYKGAVMSYDVNGTATDENPRNALDCGERSEARRLHREVIQTVGEMLDCRDIETDPAALRAALDAVVR